MVNSELSEEIGTTLKSVQGKILLEKNDKFFPFIYIFENDNNKNDITTQGLNNSDPDVKCYSNASTESLVSLNSFRENMIGRDIDIKTNNNNPYLNKNITKLITKSIVDYYKDDEKKCNKDIVNDFINYKKNHGNNNSLQDANDYLIYIFNSLYKFSYDENMYDNKKYNATKENAQSELVKIEAQYAGAIEENRKRFGISTPVETPAEKAAREAREKTAREAREKTARDTAARVTVEAAETARLAAKAAAEKAIREAAEKADRDAVAAREAAEKAAREFAAATAAAAAATTEAEKKAARE